MKEILLAHCFMEFADLVMFSVHYLPNMLSVYGMASVLNTSCRPAAHPILI